MNHSTTLFLTIAVLSAAGCATQNEPRQEDQEPLTVEDILASVPNPEDYSESVICLHRDSYVQVEVINRELLLFHGRRDRVWLNRLRRPCIGLRRDDTLAFDMRNSRLCDLDTFSSFDTFGRGPERSSAMCSLGKFETLSPEQANALIEGLSRRAAPASRAASPAREKRAKNEANSPPPTAPPPD